jgi:FMNH2-dependent dimethyl sulfone monooxygenase
LPPEAVTPSRVGTFSRNTFKLGLFGANLSSGRSATKVPERWSGSWDDNLQIAQLADDAGMDFHLPVARWKGYGGATNFEGAGFESTSWACGLLAATKRMTVFATVHAPLAHPVYAAKQFVTADHISHGRFGLNLVCGWNGDEFDMFGVARREHLPFDFNGVYFQLKNVEAEPKPFGGTRPIIMNAGTSVIGRQFSITHADMLFRAWMSLEENRVDNEETLAAANASGREIGIYTSGYAVCRPTRAEALEYERYVADENGDWDAIDNMIELSIAGHSGPPPDRASAAFMQRRRRIAVGHGGYPVVGNPDECAAALAKLHEAGFAGFAFSFVNYIDEFPYFRDEVLPRLERLGLRNASRTDVYSAGST